jgi:hypothetical protein
MLPGLIPCRTGYEEFEESIDAEGERDINFRSLAGYPSVR